MDTVTQSLVAVGAAAAVNCRPCLEHLVPVSVEAGATNDDIRQAIDAGLRVNRGAHAKTKGFIEEVLAAQLPDNGSNSGCCDERSADRSDCC